MDSIIKRWLSALLAIAFMVYNGYLGFTYSSVWHGTICVYYILLAVVRVVVVSFAQGGRRKSYAASTERAVHRLTCILLLLVNLSLILPITLMIRGERTYPFGLIPAIAMAANTVYHIVLCAVRKRKVKTLLQKDFWLIDLIAALVSVLTLQNTLVLVVEGGIYGEMKLLSILSGTAVWLFIVILLSFSLRVK